jgi:hypothetical protein
MATNWTQILQEETDSVNLMAESNQPNDAPD